MVYELFKRAFDLAVATAGLVMLSPLVAAASLAVRKEMGRPVFFNQLRAGIGGKPFTLWKLRTMRGWYWRGR